MSEISLIRLEFKKKWNYQGPQSLLFGSEAIECMTWEATSLEDLALDIWPQAKPFTHLTHRDIVGIAKARLKRRCHPAVTAAWYLHG